MGNSFVAGVDDAGTEDTDATETGAADEDSDNDDAGDETDDGAVTFASRDDFVKAVNKIVKTRLDRNNKKYAPVVAERDTLKSKVQEWTPLIEGKQTEDQKRTAREQQQQAQIDELLGYQRSTQRNELVRRVARDKGLPEEFISRIQGDDEDAITADVEDFLDVLKLDDAATGNKKITKNTKPESKDDGKGGKGSAGGKGSENEETIDPLKLAASIGRYGRTPYVVGR